ncbi:glyoxalase I [Trametopsis cervina]|nr:glyoxalase I [Trametopsis cervina]
MPSAETQGYRFNHTMIRVKDPKPSLNFYTEILGMTLIHSSVMSDFTLYFLGYGEAVDPEGSLDQKNNALVNREGVLELTHNHGTESDPDFAGYASGNSEPGRGFGHIAISVPDLEGTCARLESLGVPFKKKLTEGRMKNVAFALDPDGYWVEIISHQRF